MKAQAKKPHGERRIILSIFPRDNDKISVGPHIQVVWTSFLGPQRVSRRTKQTIKHLQNITPLNYVLQYFVNMWLWNLSGSRRNYYPCIMQPVFVLSMSSARYATDNKTSIFHHVCKMQCVYYIYWKYTPALRPKISSKLMFASCVWYSDRAYYEMCVLIENIGRRLPLQLQCSYQGQQRWC